MTSGLRGGDLLKGDQGPYAEATEEATEEATAEREEEERPGGAGTRGR